MALEERWRSDRSPLVFLQFADELRRSGQTHRAIEILREGLEWHPESVSGWVVLGRTMLEEGDPRSALEALEKALDRDPAQLVATKLSAEAWIALRDAERAAEALSRYRLLSAPGAELERLEGEIAAIRAGGRSGATAPAVVAGGDPNTVSWSSATAGGERPFELPRPAAWPALDLGSSGRQMPAWRHVEIEPEPFRQLLAMPGGAVSRRLARLAANGPFGGPAVRGDSSPAVEVLEPPTRIEIEAVSPPTVDDESPAVAVEAGLSVEPPAVAVTGIPEALEPEPPEAAVVEKPAIEGAAESAADSPAELVFEPMSIGEEVERETASAVEGASETPARISGSSTLAALYLAQGHLDEAEAEFRSVLDLRPGDESALTALTRIAALRSDSTASATRDSDAVAARPLGLTARKVTRLRALYERLRGDRLARSSRVS